MNPESVAAEEGLDFWRERETLVMELTEHHGWQALCELARHEVEAKKQRLLGGAVESHEGYVRLTAEIRGAEWVLSLPEQVSEIVRTYRRIAAELNGADSGP